MLTPILCFTCGCPIGDKDDLFRHMMETVSVDAKKGAPTEKKMTPEEILESLGIHYDCCRKSLVTSMNFLDYY